METEVRKMTKVAGERFYVKYKDCQKGDELARGNYIGTEQGKFGIQHLFDLGDGKTKVLNSSGHLNWLMEEHVSPGDFVQVMYGGMEKLTKGPMKDKDAHRFELFVDQEDLNRVEKRHIPAPQAATNEAVKPIGQ